MKKANIENSLVNSNTKGMKVSNCQIEIEQIQFKKKEILDSITKLDMEIESENSEL